MRGIKAAIAFIIIGLLVFTSMAVFSVPIWAHIYAVWDKSVHLILSLLVLKFTKKQYGNLFRPVVWICLVRLSWDILCWATGWDINDTIGVAVLFILYSLYALYATTTAKNA